MTRHCRVSPTPLSRSLTKKLECGGRQSRIAPTPIPSSAPAKRLAESPFDSTACMHHPTLPYTPTTAEAPSATFLRHGSPTPCATPLPMWKPPPASNLTYSPPVASGRAAPPPSSVPELTPTPSSSSAGGALTPCSATFASKPPPTPNTTPNVCSNTGASRSRQVPTHLTPSTCSRNNSRPPSPGFLTQTLAFAPNLRASAPPNFPPSLSPFTLPVSACGPLWTSKALAPVPRAPNANLGVERVG